MHPAEEVWQVLPREESLRKKVPQVLPRAENVVCGRRCSSASVTGQKWSQQKKVFFRGLLWKKLKRFFGGCQRKNTFFRWLHFRPLTHTRKKLLLAKELRLQPPAPNNNNVVYPKAINAILTDIQSQWS